jgi:hypothetical protein
MRTLKKHLQFFARALDTIPALRAGHIALIVLAAALLNVGAFAVLILGHMCLDVIKYRDGKTGWGGAFRRTWHANIVDVALLVISFTIALYFHHTGGIIVISGIVRADVLLLQALVVFLPKAKILYRTLHSIQVMQSRMTNSFPLQWTPGRAFATAAIAVCVLLLIVAPIVLKIQSGSLVGFVERELVPWHL